MHHQKLTFFEILRRSAIITHISLRGEHKRASINLKSSWMLITSSNLNSTTLIIVYPGNGWLAEPFNRSWNCQKFVKKVWKMYFLGSWLIFWPWISLYMLGIVASIICCYTYRVKVGLKVPQSYFYELKILKKFTLHSVAIWAKSGINSVSHLCMNLFPRKFVHVITITWGSIGNRINALSRST